MIFSHHRRTSHFLHHRPCRFHGSYTSVLTRWDRLQTQEQASLLTSSLFDNHHHLPCWPLQGKNRIHKKEEGKASEECYGKVRRKKGFLLIWKFDFDLMVCLVCLTQAQGSPERLAATRLHERPHTLMMTTGQQIILATELDHVAAAHSSEVT